MDYTAIDWRSAALLIIDVQRDFVDGAMPVAGTADLLPNLARLVDAARAANRPIVHAIRLYEPGGSDVDLVRRADVEAGLAVVAPGTAGADIPAELTGGRRVPLDADLLLRGEPQHLSDREIVMFKPRWSAFHRTRLEMWLSDWGVTSLVVAGCNLPNCPRATLFDASERDFRAAVVADAVSQATPERLADLVLIGVNMLALRDAAQALRGLPSGPDDCH